MKEVVVLRNFSIEEADWKTVLLVIFTQQVGIGKTTIFLRPAMNLFNKIGKVLLGCFVTNGDVDFALGHNEVCNLVVFASAQTQLLQMLSREHMVLVTAVE